MSDKPRLQYFDMLKGLAIFAVVMGHVITICIRDIDQSVVFKIIARTHMPLFFFISGYFSYKHAKDGRDFVTPKLWARFKQLMVPFVVVSAIWIYYFPYSGLQSPFVPTFEGLYLSESKLGYWFNPCLFAIMVVYALATPILRRTRGFVAEACVMVAMEVVLLALVAVSSDSVKQAFELFSIATYFPLFALGVFSRKYRSAYDRAVSSQWIVTTAYVVGALALYVSMYYWEFPQLPKVVVNLGATMLWHLCLMVIAVNAVKPWSERAYANPDSPAIGAKVWSYLGRESLAIYLLHYFFLFPLTFMREPLLAMSLGFTPTFVFAFVVAAAVVTITLGVNYLIQRSRILALLLTGK